MSPIDGRWTNHWVTRFAHRHRMHHRLRATYIDSSFRTFHYAFSPSIQMSASRWSISAQGKTRRHLCSRDWVLSEPCRRAISRSDHVFPHLPASRLKMKDPDSQLTLVFIENALSLRTDSHPSQSHLSCSVNA